MQTHKVSNTVFNHVRAATDKGFVLVHPAHIAFVLLNEGDGNSASLFSSVIERAGGDPVSTVCIY